MSTTSAPFCPKTLKECPLCSMELEVMWLDLHKRIKMCPDTLCHFPFDQPNYKAFIERLPKKVNTAFYKGINPMKRPKSSVQFPVDDEVKKKVKLQLESFTIRSIDPLVNDELDMSLYDVPPIPDLTLCYERRRREGLISEEQLQEEAEQAELHRLEQLQREMEEEGAMGDLMNQRSSPLPNWYSNTADQVKSPEDSMLLNHPSSPTKFQNKSNDKEELLTQQSPTAKSKEQSILFKNQPRANTTNDDLLGFDLGLPSFDFSSLLPTNNYNFTEQNQSNLFSNENASTDFNFDFDLGLDLGLDFKLDSIPNSLPGPSTDSTPADVPNNDSADQHAPEGSNKEVQLAIPDSQLMAELFPGLDPSNFKF